MLSIAIATTVSTLEDKGWRAKVLLLLTSLLVVSCSAGTVDKARHESLYRTGKHMEGAISVGVNLVRYRELLQQLATEVSISRDKASNQAERDMVAAFNSALVAYRDAGTLWEKKVGGASELSPSGDADLSRIVDAYPISGNGTGVNFRFPVDDAVHTVWHGAGAKLSLAFQLYNGETVDLPTPPGR